MAENAPEGLTTSARSTPAKLAPHLVRPPATDQRALWKRWWRILLDTHRKSVEDQAKDLGAAVTYWVFFSIFPMLIGMIALAGFFLGSAQAQQQVFAIVNDMLPGSGPLVEEQLGAVIAARGTLSIIGIGTLLWSGSAGLGAITRAMNRAWGTYGHNPSWRARIRYFAMMIGLAALLTASIGLSAFMELLPTLPLEPLAQLGLHPDMIDQLKGIMISFFFVFVMFTVIYKMTPNIRITWRQVLPGALFAAVLFELAKAGFLVYLTRFADYSVYGSLGSIIILMLWLYCSARVLIFCGEFNVVLDRGSEDA